MEVLDQLIGTVWKGYNVLHYRHWEIADGDIVSLTDMGRIK